MASGSRSRQGDRLALDRARRPRMAQDLRQGLHRWALLHRVDGARRGRHPQRAMALSSGETRKPTLANRALARAFGRRGATGDRSGPGRRDSVRHPVFALPQAKRSWRVGDRTRSQSAHESGRISDPEGLNALIRNPKSVRTWPMQQMPGFPPESLSDREIDLVIAHLQHMAGRKEAP
jgi:hypothetical protein